MKTLNKYTFEITQDNGSFELCTKDISEEQAIKKIMAYEGCPRSAIRRMQ